jgi:glycerate kinase
MCVGFAWPGRVFPIRRFRQIARTFTSISPGKRAPISLDRGNALPRSPASSSPGPPSPPPGAPNPRGGSAEAPLTAAPLTVLYLASGCYARAVFICKAWSDTYMMTRPLRVVVAPDSYKGSLTAAEVCEALEVGLRRACSDVEVVRVPMADGGEGTVQSLVDATGGHIVNLRVTGPLGTPVDSFYGVLGDGATAVIEMAAASGLPLVPRELRNPRLTSTRGTGELISAAFAAGCRKFIIGIGGSATNDGGAGMAQALGAQLMDADDREVGPGGAELARVASVDLTGIPAELRACEFVVACDVDNPLTGPRGASAVYGPQKGATPEMVRELDAALSAYAEAVARAVGTDVAALRDAPGAGAAGGLGFGLMAFLGAQLKRGVEIVVDAVSLREKLHGADLVITGEGRTDFQTLYGKTPMGVAHAAMEQGIPVVIISGSIADDARGLYEHGIGALVSIVRGPMSLDDAIARGRELVADAAETVLRMFLLGTGARAREEGAGKCQR